MKMMLIGEKGVFFLPGNKAVDGIEEENEMWNGKDSAIRRLLVVDNR